MRVLVIAHYQGDGSPCAIFIHEQMKKYVQLGCKVLAIIPIAVMKKNEYGNRFMRTENNFVDSIDCIFLRHLSFSSYGQDGINSFFAIRSLNHRIVKRIQDFNPDIIHAHTFGTDSDIGVYLKNRLNIPLVVTTHGSDFWLKVKNRKTDSILKASQFADRVVAVSSKLENDFRTINNTDNVSIILNGCDVEKCVVAKKKPMSLLFVGNLIKRKNVDIVIKAFAKLKPTFVNATLTIVGNGSEKTELVKLSDELGVKDGICFTGHISNFDVIRHMSESDYFVMPSEGEAFGIVYIEAMASGCVTIGTNNEGIDGFIVNGENGLLVNPDSEEIVKVIRECEKNITLKEKVRCAGIEKAKDMSWDKNARKYISLFNLLEKN